jgi:hypothetical protein
MSGSCALRSVMQVNSVSAGGNAAESGSKEEGQRSKIDPQRQHQMAEREVRMLSSSLSSGRLACHPMHRPETDLHFEYCD